MFGLVSSLILRFHSTRVAEIEQNFRCSLQKYLREDKENSDQLKTGTKSETPLTSFGDNKKAVNKYKPGEKPETPMTDLGDNLEVLNKCKPEDNSRTFEETATDP